MVLILLFDCFPLLVIGHNINGMLQQKMCLTFKVFIVLWKLACLQLIRLLSDIRIFCYAVKCLLMQTSTVFIDPNCNLGALFRSSF